MPKFVVTQENGCFDGVRLHPKGSVLELEKHEYHAKLSVEFEPFIDEDGNVDEQAQAALEKVRGHLEDKRAAQAAGAKGSDVPGYPFPPPSKTEKRVAQAKAAAAQRKAAVAKEADSKPSGRAADQQ